MLGNDTIRAEGIANIFVFLNDDTLGSYFTSIGIIPVDGNLFTDRNFKNTRVYYLLPNIVMDRTAVNKSYDEYISDELKRDIFVEKDPTKNCVKYPNA